MAKYFNYFPQTQYAFNIDPNNIQVVTNLTNKFSFEDSFKNNTVLFYEYSVVDGETPEILAHKLYGSSERHWIILAMNDIYNPQMDWPVENRSLHDIIEYKYVGNANTANGQTGIEWSQSNNHSYYKIETQIDNTTQDEYKKVTCVDLTTYNTISDTSRTYTLKNGNSITVKTTKDAKSYYEYEIEQNDKKRLIKILKPEFVATVEEEFHNIFK
jgi:hypothetical protein